jgi:hypothetical protein
VRLLSIGSDSHNNIIARDRRNHIGALADNMSVGAAVGFQQVCVTPGAITTNSPRVNVIVRLSCVTASVPWIIVALGVGRVLMRRHTGMV